MRVRSSCWYSVDRRREASSPLIREFVVDTPPDFGEHEMAGMSSRNRVNGDIYSLSSCMLLLWDFIKFPSNVQKICTKCKCARFIDDKFHHCLISRTVFALPHRVYVILNLFQTNANKGPFKYRSPNIVARTRSANSTSDAGGSSNIIQLTVWWQVYKHGSLNAISHNGYR